MNVEIVMRWLCKPAVVVSHKLFGKGVCGLRRTDIGQTPLLDQAVLLRQLSPFNTALAELVLALMPVMFSSFMIRPN